MDDAEQLRELQEDETREGRLKAEMLKQAAIYRPGTDAAILRRAAISALMERGEY